MTGFCSRCGRDRPIGVAGSSCAKGGDCDWVTAPPTENSLFVEGNLVAFRFEGVHGYMIGQIAHVTADDIHLVEAYGVHYLGPTTAIIAQSFGRTVVNRTRFTFATECSVEAHKAAQVRASAQESPPEEAES